MKNLLILLLSFYLISCCQTDRKKEENARSLSKSNEIKSGTWEFSKTSLKESNTPTNHLQNNQKINVKNDGTSKTATFKIKGITKIQSCTDNDMDRDYFLCKNVNFEKNKNIYSGMLSIRDNAFGTTKCIEASHMPDNCDSGHSSCICARLTVECKAGKGGNCGGPDDELGIGGG